MKIPKTTEKEPYIEFSFDKKGKLIKLSKTSTWWGGKNSGFISSNACSGNSCLPKDLDSYIKAFKLKKIKEIEKEIELLKIKLSNTKNSYFC